MTLWVKKLGPILGLALLAFACEDPGEIGIEINPENGTFVARYFEIPIANAVVQQEEVVSGNTTRINPLTQEITDDGRLLVGDIASPEVGKLKSIAYANFYPNKYGFRDDDYVFDSLIFNVRVDYIYGNNFIGNKRIYVHELSDSIKLDSLYLTNNSTPYLPDPLGEFSFDPSGFDTISVDTVYSTRLSDELGMRLLDKAKGVQSISDTMAYYNNRLFRDFFKGIALVGEDQNGIVAGIHAESQSTFMRMYFHNTEDTTTLDFVVPGYVQDSIFIKDEDNIIIDTTFDVNNLTRYYNRISLDKSGTPIEGIPDYYTEFQTDNNLTYIQGSTGVFTKLNFGKYFIFLDTVKNLVINRAELIMPIEPYDDYLQPSPGLSLYFADENNRFYTAGNTDSLQLSYAVAGGLTYSELPDTHEGEFSGNITNYIQALTSGVSTDSLILVGQSSLYKSVLSVNQSVIQKDKILLKVYYSSLK